jgi:hypothetical protein
MHAAGTKSARGQDQRDENHGAPGHPKATTTRVTTETTTKHDKKATTVSKKQEIVIGIALQTQVLRLCPLHNQLFCDSEGFADDENMARAFAVAIELVRRREPRVEAFRYGAHELTDLLSSTIGAAPDCCPDCLAQQAQPVNDRSSEVYAFR